MCSPGGILSGHDSFAVPLYPRDLWGHDRRVPHTVSTERVRLLIIFIILPFDIVSPAENTTIPGFYSEPYYISGTTRQTCVYRFRSNVDDVIISSGRP